jgi:hypothetical protein
MQQNVNRIRLFACSCDGREGQAVIPHGLPARHSGLAMQRGNDWRADELADVPQAPPQGKPPLPRSQADRRIFLPKAGRIRIAIHRPIASKIKNVTVSTIAGEWFVSAQMDWRRSFRPTRVPRSESKSEAPNRPCSPTGRCSASRGQRQPTGASWRTPPAPSIAARRGRRTGRRPNSDWPGCRPKPPVAGGTRRARQPRPSPRTTGGRRRGPEVQQMAKTSRGRGFRIGPDDRPGAETPVDIERSRGIEVICANRSKTVGSVGGGTARLYSSRLIGRWRMEVRWTRRFMKQPEFGRQHVIIGSNRPPHHYDIARIHRTSVQSPCTEASTQFVCVL